jgi:hypothetical protein
MRRKRVFILLNALLKVRPQKSSSRLVQLKILRGGRHVMHVADYIAIGVLTACILGAAVVFLSRRES